MQGLRKILCLLGLVLGSNLAFGQTSAITATITDTDGQTWNSGPYTIQLVNSSGQPIAAGGAYRIDTGATITNSFSGTLDGSGALSVTLTTTSNINPAGTKWKFGICPNTIPAVCGGTSLAVSASGSLSSQLSASILPPRIGGGPGTQAYADVEVAATPNNSYLNVGSLAGLRCYASSWAACGGGGGGAPSGPAGGFLSGTYPNPGGPTATVAGQQVTWDGAAYGAQSKIALDPRDYGADFNGGVAFDCSTTNGSNAITCPNSDANFPSNIAGYIFFATAGTGVSATAGLDNPSITFGGNLQTTVATYVNANSITVVGNSNTTTTATALIAWFPKDSTTALNAWWAAGGCHGAYRIPVGFTLFSSPIMQNIAGCPGAVNSGTGYQGQAVFGAGVGSSFLIPAPVFTYTSILGTQATNCAVGNLNIEHSEEYTVWGLGERATGSINACLWMLGIASSGFRIDLVGWNSRGGGTNLTGLYALGNSDKFDTGGSNYFGTVEEWHVGSSQTFLNNFVSGNSSLLNATCGMHVTGTSTLISLNNYYGVCAQVDTGGSMVSTSTTYAAADAAALYANGGAITFNGGDLVNTGGAATTGINFSSTGSKVVATGKSINGIVGAASNTFIDNCGNIFTGTVTLNGMLWPSSCSVLGVAAAAGNIALGAGFGTSPTATAFSANADFRHFTFTLTVGSGAQTQATSTVTYTFPTTFNKFIVAPGSCHAQQIGGTNAMLTFQTTTLPTTTSVVFTPTAAATASATIILSVDCQ